MQSNQCVTFAIAVAVLMGISLTAGYSKEGSKADTAATSREESPREASQQRTNSPADQAISANDIVVDKTKGLMWHKSGTPAALMLSAAEAYASSLKVGGHDDWRLPTLWELNHLYLELRGDGTDGRSPVFEWCQPPNYWSSTRSEELGTSPTSNPGIRLKTVGATVKIFDSDLWMTVASTAQHCARAVRGRVSARYMQRSIEQLHSTDPATRWDGLTKLERIVGPEAIEALDNIKSLLSDPNEQIANKATDVLTLLQGRN